MMATNSSSSISTFIASLKFIKKHRIDCDNEKLNIYQLGPKPPVSPLTSRRRSFSSGNLLSEDFLTSSQHHIKADGEKKGVAGSMKLRRKSFNRKYFSSNNASAENLYKAVLNENVESVKHYAFSEGTDVNHIRSSGWTVFHHACRVGNIEILEMLVNAGANVKILARGGVTPLSIAVTHGNFEVADFLISRIGVSCDEIKDGFQSMTCFKSPVVHERTQSR